MANTERPILFPSQSVRRIIDGSKTQTRRVMKQKYHGKPLQSEEGFYDVRDGLILLDEQKRVRCPYGIPGDRLWLRETWKHFFKGETPSACKYLADAGTNRWLNAASAEHALASWPNWKPSIHMPRWASRLTLEIVKVRVERLQDISEQDAIAEGVEPVVCMGSYNTFKNYAPGLPAHHLPRDSYRTLWDSTNGKKHPWASNPWVWVIEFFLQ